MKHAELNTGTKSSVHWKMDKKLKTLRDANILCFMWINLCYWWKVRFSSSLFWPLCWSLKLFCHGDCEIISTLEQSNSCLHRWLSHALSDTFFRTLQTKLRALKRRKHFRLHCEGVKQWPLELNIYQWECCAGDVKRNVFEHDLRLNLLCRNYYFA